MTNPNNIVLLHGWGASTEKLRPLASELSREGWTTLVLGLPGLSGESPPPGEWGVDEYADWVYDKAQEKFAREKFFVFGHSFGGRITIKLAAQESKEIKGVIICAAAGLSRTNPLKRLFFLVLARLGKPLAFFPVTRSFANLFRKLLYKAAREHDYEKAQGVMRAVFKKVVSEDLRPLLPLIKVPTLILWGKIDKMTLVSSAYLAKKEITNSRLVIFSKEGHRLPYEKPKEVAEEIIKWSKSLT